MSANRNNKSQNDGDFESYRQIAPEHFSDESLRNLIKSKNNNREAIVTAIENIWHDTPEKQAVGSEWVTTTKSTIKKVAAPAPRRVDNGAGRGGGKKPNQPASGRSNESAKVEKTIASNSGKSAAQSVARATPPAVTPTVAENNTVSNAVSQEPVTTPVVAVADTAKPAWGSGPSFAAKLKMAETEKAKAAAVAAAEEKKRNTEESSAAAEKVPTDGADATSGKRSTTPKSRTRKAKPGKKGGDDAAAAVGSEEGAANADSLSAVIQDSLVIENTPAPVNSVPTIAEVVVPDAAPGLSKLSKWESSAAGASSENTLSASAVSSEIFQFGSFGSSSFAPPVQVDAKDSSASWGGAAEESVNSIVQESASVSSAWSSSADSSLLPGAVANSSIRSLFTQKSALDGSASGAPRPPPGLEHSSQIAANKQQGQNNALRSTGQQQTKFNSKETTQQQQQQQQLLQMQQQSMLYGQQPLQQYGQQTQLPPGIAAPSNSRSTLQQPSTLAASTLPYTPYTPGFDLTQSPFIHAPYNPAAGGLSLSAPGGVTPNASTGTASSTTNPAQTPLQSQQQQYAPAAPFPFYGNPYYNQAYYYGQPPQVPNFYGQQGAGRYQDQGLYGANPYGNPGSLYPPQPQAGGQFSDSSASKVAGGKTGSAAPGGAAASQQSTGGLQTQDLSMGYGGYNPYNQQQQQQQRSMDAQAWQYQQSQAQWGAGPIMNFGAPAGTGGGLQSNQQQPFAQGGQQSSHLSGMNLSGQQQPQSGQTASGNQRNGPPGSAAYGSSSFIGGNRNNNGASGGASAGNGPQGW